DQPLVHSFADQNSTWKFYDAIAAPPANWNTAAFNDTSWQQGQPAFGTATSTPILGVTADLTERYRAGALIGLVDNAQFTTWPDTATGDGVSQNATNGSEPRFETNDTPSGQPAVSFDGNDSFRTSLSPGIGPTSGFTYFVVCRATAAPDSGGTNGGDGDYIFDRDHLALAQDNPLASLKVTNGCFGFQKRYDDGSGLGGPVSTTALSQTNFQIVAVRRNTTLGRFEIWVDGNMEGTEADSGGALTPQPIVIGCHSNNTANGFKGHIAELLVYRSSLTDAEFKSVGTYLEGRYGLSTAFPDSSVQTPISATASTSYYRHSFNFAGEPSRTVLKLNHTVADGAVFYLNGQELTRTNMAGGSVGHSTPALSDQAAPTSSGFLTVPSTALVAGTNVLAVSVHTGASDDTAYFSAELQGLESPLDPDQPSALQLNEIAAANAANFFIELRNPTAVSSSTAGFSLEVIGAQPGSFPLPEGNVPAGGFASYTEAQLGFRPAAGDKVILRSPGGSLADVQAADGVVRGASAAWPGRWLFPSAATPGAVNAISLQQDIVINEICYHPPEINAASGDKQWLELYNKGAGPVNLSGWSFGAGVDFNFPNGTVMAPGGYLVIAKDPAGLLTQFPGITVAGPYGGSLAGSGERILLLDAAGNPADDVPYVDGGRWPGTPDGGGSTLELRDPRADNSLPESWAASNESSRRSWQTYTYRATAGASAVGPDGQWREFVLGMLDEGEVLLDDITVTERPGVAPVAMINGGNFESGLPVGWRFIGNHRHVQLIQDPSNPGNTVLYLAAKGPTEHMHNHVEATLIGGRSITNGYEYEISFKARWLSGSNLLNTRLYFNRCAKTTALTRTDSPGTPGSANSTAVANAGPSFTDFGHSPVVPSPGEAVTVTARAADPDGLGAFTLKYSVDGGTTQNVAMTLGTDGQTFTGSIPGQSAAKVVRFWVTGNDAAPVPASASFPADGANSHALYQVNDNLAATNGRHNVRIIMAPDDKALLYQTNNVMSNERLGCTVIYDERETYYDAGVRLKSSQRGRPVASRVGFSLGFNRDQLFRGVHRTVSIDRSEGQITGCQEILYDHMMYASGSVPAEYNDLCKVIAPDPANTSSAILQLARYGDVFLDSQFPNGGDGTSYEYELIYYPTTTDANGYKLPQPDNVVGTDIRDLGDDKENYRQNFLIENNEDKDSYAGMIALGKQFQKSGAAFESGLTNVINVDQWLRALACSCASGAGDSFFANANHNGIFYTGTDGRVLYFPHDMDFSFDATRPIDENSELQKLIADPLRKRIYFGHLYDICTRVFNNSYMQAWTTHYGSLLPGEDFAGHLSYINTRSNYILGQLNSQLPSVPFAITTNAGANFSTATSPVTLAGTGWVDVRDIRLAGATTPLQVTWTSSTTWQISVPLSAGPNLIALEGLNYAGDVVQTDSITVTNTGNIQVPTPATLVVSKIYYNPPGSVETTEYVELMNASSTLTLDLSNVNFTAGLTFTFPGGTMLAPNARTLIVKDVTAFNMAFGTGKPIAGTFPVNLDNGGAQIVLRKADGGILHDFSYDDEPPWPTEADGGGYALVLVNPFSNPDHADPLSWRASAVTGGNPGSADTQSYAEWRTANGNHPDDADLDGDGLTTRLEYFMGGNPAAPDQGLAPMFSLEEDGSIFVTVSRSVIAEDVVPAPQFSTQLSSWQTPANLEFLSSERVAGNPARDLLTFRIVPPPGTPQYFVRISFGP
ncbi:lamin tail domain-containing protein, partial [Haloferula sp. BvORR071]|uniref:lamin tail domain-containing protein n=1 Tax=Haloferula sp. BvORR071 TaxID=1396141 RepID=UPI00055296B0